MKILDAIASRSGSNQHRFGLVWILQASFFVTVLRFGIFVAFSFLRFDDNREVENLTASSNSAEVISEVQEFLEGGTHNGLHRQDELSRCWDIFEDKEF